VRAGGIGHLVDEFPDLVGHFGHRLAG
jgi:hypothetical protein